MLTTQWCAWSHVHAVADIVHYENDQYYRAAIKYAPPPVKITTFKPKVVYLEPRQVVSKAIRFSPAISRWGLSTCL